MTSTLTEISNPAGTAALSMNPSQILMSNSGNAFTVLPDSSTSTKIIAYEYTGYHNGLLTPHALTPKYYVDSVVSASGSGITGITNNYKNYVDMTGSTAANFYFSSVGTGSSVAIPTNSPIAGWGFGRVANTGTQSTGRVFGIPAASGYIPISVDTNYRYSFGTSVRFEDLSDGTETYHFFFGLGDDANAYSSIVDGIGFRYHYADSSGQFIAFTKSNSTTTEDATGVTVAADTDYVLQVTNVLGSFKYYINGTLVSTITTNIPMGTTRETSLVFSINKQAGTVARVMYIRWLGYELAQTF